LTPEELASRVGRSVDWAHALLEQERKAGHVVRRGRRWYLSAKAERRFGSALRGLPG
jgi:hypothetical protein